MRGSLPLPIPCRSLTSLPPQLRVLASLDNSTWQEANASPMLFEESTAHPDAKAALARKDAIILQRNAQLAALWAERAEMGPWQDRPRGKGPEGVASAVEKPGNATNLVVIAVNTVGVACCCWRAGVGVSSGDGVGKH